MNNLVAIPSTAVMPGGRHPQQPLIDVNFDYYLAERPKVLAHSDVLPKYLLLPEIQQLLAVTLNDRHRLLFDFLWQSGARITEALQVRPTDLTLDTPLNSFVSLTNLKRPRQTKRVGRPSRRAVPLVDDDLILNLKRHIETHRIKRQSPLFPLSRQAVDNAIKDRATEVDPPLSVEPSAHTLRHSFAINHLLHGADIRLISTWLGHTSLKSTLIYLDVFGHDTNHIAIRTRFRLP